MFNQKLRTMRSKGVLTALLEVALIFIGITLAIALENWISERNERQSSSPQGIRRRNLARDQLNFPDCWPVAIATRQIGRL
jgi:hypothetical protein